MRQKPQSWVLQSRADDAVHEPGTALPRRVLLVAAARRALPGIVEASLIPAAIFLLTNSLLGSRGAMLGVLVWGCASVMWHRQRGRTLPALVALTLCGLTVRTLVGVASGSVIAYFAQPIATMVVIATVLVVSLRAGRPLVARIAHDFCPIGPEVAKRPAVIQLFAGLTVLWAGAQLLTAGATLAMLLSLNTTTFVMLKSMASLAISAAAIAVTISWAMRVAHREQLVFVAV